MRLSTQVREARKQAHLQRLERKGGADYTSFYASQPFQQSKRLRNLEVKETRRLIKNLSAQMEACAYSGGDTQELQVQLEAARSHLKSLTGGA